MILLTVAVTAAVIFLSMLFGMSVVALLKTIRVSDATIEAAAQIVRTAPLAAPTVEAGFVQGRAQVGGDHHA